MNTQEKYNALASTILKTYTDRYSQLDAAHRFHFASRLYHWTHSDWSRQMLQNEKPFLLPSTKDTDVITTLQEIIASGSIGMEKMNAAEIRQPYFEKYPDLRGTTFALFRLRHWLTCYDFDARNKFTSAMVNIDALQTIEDMVFSDLPAVSALSTHAVNFYYLKNRLIEQNNKIPKNIIHDTLQLYDLTNKQDILLYVYLLTHCIIGESLFYVNPITGSNREFYLEYMKTMTTLILDHYNDINLDNKCEFLVCARLLNYDTPELKERIYNEAVSSISSNGFYIVDTHNTAKRPDRTDLQHSEHRNVLCIMAFGDRA